MEEREVCFTAETHNFPTAICPFEGAATGTGGRIRDNHATGRGARTGVGTVGYCVGALGALRVPLEWRRHGAAERGTGDALDEKVLGCEKVDSEHAEYVYRAPNFADPRTILIEASNGASDYGNKFGEPLICGILAYLQITAVEFYF